MKYWLGKDAIKYYNDDIDWEIIYNIISHGKFSYLEALSNLKQQLKYAQKVLSTLQSHWKLRLFSIIFTEAIFYENVRKIKPYDLRSEDNQIKQYEFKHSPISMRVINYI